MTELQIYVGSKVRINGEWRQPADPASIPSATDPLADPSGLALRLYLPDGTEILYTYGTDPNPVKDVVGKYHADYVVAQSGQHRYSWLPTGNAAQPISGEFYAHPI